MNLHPQPRILAVLALLLVPAIQPTALYAQSCAGQEPARHVPGPPPNHDPAAPDVDLWLTDVFRPGLTNLSNRQLPAERDSTGWDSLTVPGYDFGHEIFESLDVAGDYLYVAYNAGFSIWDISGTNAENPSRAVVRDGWNLSNCQSDPNCGGFLDFPHPGEVDFLIEDIDVLEAGGNNVYIAVSGRNPVGISLWRFNTSTESLTALYQDITLNSRQVRLVEVNDTRGTTTIYAFSSYGNGLAVYDVTRADAIDPCLEETGSDCPGVYVGNLGNVSTGRYVDVLARPNGQILVATSNGNLGGQGLELWRVDPSSPGTADQLFDGLNNRTFGIAMFSYEGNDYLATLERDGTVNVIKIFNINSCVSGSCTLGAPVYNDTSVPPRLSNQFMTYSTSTGTPFLYYGLVGGFGGPKVEQLLDLTTLGRPGQNIKEITDGSPTYFDACENANLGYWAWYYPGNEFGPNNLAPRVGKFDPGSNIFYRAAGGILDVHVWEAGDTTLDPTITTTVANPDPQGLYWMTDEITFEGTGSNGCNPAGVWSWTANTPADVNAVSVSEVGNQVTYRFECTATRGAVRCADSAVSVSGTNSDPSCAGAMTVQAGISVKDPALEITSITPDGGAFTQCAVVTFEAALLGRGPVDYGWSINSVEVETGTAPEEDLSTSMVSFDWDTTMVTFDEIFSDGFESGDTSAWSLVGRRGTIPVTIGLALDGGSPSDSVNVDLSPVTGDPAFETPAITSSTLDSATFDFQANTVVGTVSEWTWELEDDNGSSLCVFGADTDVPCTIKTGQAISHTWVLQNGDRRVDVTVGNCQTTTTAEESTTVAVVSLAPLVLESFELDRMASADNGSCEIDFGCITDLLCICHVNETVVFEVVADGDPDFFDFDWDGNGSFEDQNNPATGTEYTHVYPLVIGQVKPAVRARRGAATPVEEDLRETLDIQP